MIGATRYTTTVEIARQGKLSSDIAKLQTQVSTGKRLTAASDDPNAAARIADIARTQANDAVYTRNADAGATIASTVDSQLATIGSALNRANEILLTARNDTNSTVNRQSLATELRGIAQDLTGYANATDTTGNPLFPDAPLAIPVSDTLSISATAAKASVFTIPTGNGTSQSLSDFLTAAADRLAAGGTGNTTGTTTGGTSGGSAISADIATMASAIDHITAVRTDQGIRAQRFDDARTRLASVGTDLTTERSGLEDTDLTYALSQVQAKQLSLQAAQTLFAQTHKNGLFNLIG